MMLVTVRGGPTLHLWRDGVEVARVPLDTPAALELAAALLREARAAMARGEVHRHGRSKLEPDKVTTAANLGLRRDEEYDAAQARGEVAGHGGARNFKVPDGNVETCSADLGMRRKEIHEARKLRDAAQARGEVATRGGERSGLQHSPLAPTTADLGLRRDEIHEAHQ
jgi:hypothetical protein